MNIAQPKLGPRMKRRRIDLGLSLRETARRAGINQGLLHRIEAGGGLELSTLNKILDALDLRLIVRNK